MASDYTPPRLVKPTPGGNPGDGSLDGALTVQAKDGQIFNILENSTDGKTLLAGGK